LSRPRLLFLRARAAPASLYALVSAPIMYNKDLITSSAVYDGELTADGKKHGYSLDITNFRFWQICVAV
jgi:hypothetical protein